MYMPNPNDVIQALDAKTGDLIWEHERESPESARRTAGLLGSNNRNIAIYGNLIIDTGVDASLFALDAETGEMVWESPGPRLSREPRHPRRRADHRQRQGGLRAKLPALPRPPRLRHRRPRCPDRQGSLAAAADSRAG